MHGILVDHRDPVAAQLAQLFPAFADQLLAHKLDAAPLDIAIAPQKVDNRPSDRALATAGFADNTIRFTAPDRKRDILHCFNFAAAHLVGNGEIFDF